MSLWIIIEVSNKLKIFAYIAVTFKEKMEKVDIMTLTVLLLTFQR